VSDVELVSDHDITPRLGTAYTLTGLRASLLEPGDYPVEAVCLECGRPIRCEQYFHGEWYHFDRDEPPVNFYR
jgi:hypothetical protein